MHVLGWWRAKSSIHAQILYSTRHSSILSFLCSRALCSHIFELKERPRCFCSLSSCRDQFHWTSFFPQVSCPLTNFHPDCLYFYFFLQNLCRWHEFYQNGCFSFYNCSMGRVFVPFLGRVPWVMLKTRRSNEINKISHCLECLSWRWYFAITSLDRVSNCKHTGVSREATFV